MQHLNRKSGQVQASSSSDPQVQEKTERLQSEQRRVEDAIQNIKASSSPQIHHTVQMTIIASMLGYMENLQTGEDKLKDMINNKRKDIEDAAESGRIDDSHLKQIERLLTRHIKEKISNSQIHEQVQKQLQEDDYIDYLLIVMLGGVGLVGFFMWDKVRKQQNSFLL